MNPTRLWIFQSQYGLILALETKTKFQNMSEFQSQYGLILAKIGSFASNFLSIFQSQYGLILAYHEHEPIICEDNYFNPNMVLF